MYHTRSTAALAWLCLAIAQILGCSPRTAHQGGAAVPPPDAHKGRPAAPDRLARIAFRAQELPFRYDRGETGSAWPVETTGGGVGLLDYDGDGDLDLFFAQGGPLLAFEKGTPRTGDVLLRNDGAGKFVDVSREAGLTWKGYGQGVTIADYDGDGDSDVYVTRYGRNTLWRNDAGHFVDATATAGVGCRAWSLGAAFFDADGDGDLDLFVANYFSFDESRAPFAKDPETGRPDYGPPAEFPGQPDVLFRNDGQGSFSDVTVLSGVAGKARGMGCMAADFDGDGRMDVLVANDAEENALWRNKGDGTFEDVAGSSGLAVNGEGQTEANMGVSRGDTDGDGLEDVLISHFFGEHHTLWRQKRLPDGQTLYQDETSAAGLGLDSRPLTGWGVGLVDFDQDGQLDFLVTNGHIRKEREQKYLYENPPILWRNQGDSRFQNVTTLAGPYFRALHMGRGLAIGDLDGDGDLDVVIVHHAAPAVVLWNESPTLGGSLILDLRGVAPNTDAIGAKVTATVGGQRIVRSIVGGGGYISSDDRRIHIGLGSAKQADKVTVLWPSGRVESRTNLAAGTLVRWRETAKKLP
jgi:enediyne biosynthesis protein E4